MSRTNLKNTEMKFTASRLSEGNKIFPAEIHIEASGVTIKIPGLFSGESKFFDFQHIASVDVQAPMIGYSTVTFYAGGTQISAHGFTSSEVKQIKQAIHNGKSNAPVISYSNSDFPTGANQSGESGGGLFGYLKHNHESLVQSVENDKNREREEKQQIEGKVDYIAHITFGTTVEEISNQLSHLVTIGNAKPDKKVKSAIVEKMEFGIMKLKGLRANTEADFFEKKLEPLKKKTWF